MIICHKCGAQMLWGTPDLWGCNFCGYTSDMEKELILTLELTKTDCEPQKKDSL
jgi:hypothetical protein